MQTAIYMRVSSRSQADEHGTDAQRESIERWLSVMGMNMSDCLVFEDLAKTGRNTNRPRWKQMRDEMAAGHVERVVFYSLSRAGRSVADMAEFIDWCIKHGVEIVSLKEQMDTHTPMGKAMAQIALVFAELESSYTAERVRDGIAAARKSKGGLWGAQLKAPGTGGGRSLNENQEENFIRLAPTTSDAELARTFKIHRKTVSRLRERLGLKKKS